MRGRSDAAAEIDGAHRGAILAEGAPEAIRANAAVRAVYLGSGIGAAAH